MTTRSFITAADVERGSDPVYATVTCPECGERDTYMGTDIDVYLSEGGPMPYVDQSVREAIARGEPPEDVGALTFVLYQTVVDYIARKSERYQTFADVLAAWSATSLELYVRRIQFYEQAKRIENGDVLPS